MSTDTKKWNDSPPQTDHQEDNQGLVILDKGFGFYSQKRV